MGSYCNGSGKLSNCRDPMCSFDENIVNKIIDPIEIKKINLVFDDIGSKNNVINEKYKIRRRINKNLLVIKSIENDEKFIMKKIDLEKYNKFELNQEVRLLLTLKKQNFYFQEIINVLKTEDYLYVIYSYCKKSLKHMKLNDNLKLIKEYFRDIIYAITILNERGVGHLFINPSTVMFDEMNNLKLTNFSKGIFTTNCYGDEYLLTKDDIKERFDNIDVTFNAYIAPEIIDMISDNNNIENEKYVISGISVDIYAAGVILLAMISSKLDSDFNIDDEIIKIDDEDLKDLLEKMLTNENKERIKIGDIIKSRWFNDD